MIAFVAQIKGWKSQVPLTDNGIIGSQGIYVTPHLMWDGRLKPRLFSRSLCKPWPDGGDVQNPQVLKQYTSTPTERLDDEVIEKIIGGFRKVVRKNDRDVGWIVDNIGNDGGDTGRD